MVRGGGGECYRAPWVVRSGRAVVGSLIIVAFDEPLTLHPTGHARQGLLRACSGPGLTNRGCKVRSGLMARYLLV